MLTLEISLHLLCMPHFVEEVIVRAEGSVIPRLVTSVLHFFMYTVERGSRMFSNLSWGCSSLGEGSVILFQMHLNGFLKNIPQN